MKVKISRKRKPWLARETKQLFAFGKTCGAICNMLATYGGNAGRQSYEIARTKRTEYDVALKEVTISYRIEQAKRTELLNAETRLRLENAFGAERVAAALGEPVKKADTFQAAHTVPEDD
jgi:hypothetical protein